MFKDADKDYIDDEAYLKNILSYFRLRQPFYYGYRDLMKYIFCFRFIFGKKKDNEALY